MQFKNLSCVTKKVVGKVQTAQCVRVSAKNDIAKVLSVGVDSIVNNYEVASGEATFYGKTNIKMVYSDGVALNGANYNADFTATIQSDLLDSSVKMVFDVSTVDVKVDFTANTATFNILLEITAYAYVSQTTPYLVAGEDYFCQEEPVEVVSVSNVENYATSVEQSLVSSKPISTVLLAESSVGISEHVLSNGILTLTGNALVRLTYLSNGDLVTDSFPFVFQKEIDASNLPTESQLQIIVKSKSTKVRLDISEEENNTSFSVETLLNVVVEATKIEVVNIVTDAYATNCDYVFDRIATQTTLPLASNFQVVSSNHTLPLDASKQYCSAVNASAYVTKATPNSRSCAVEGVICATMLYSSDNGFECENVEIPFVCKVDVDYVDAQCECFATVSLNKLDFSCTNIVQVQSELCVSVTCCRTQERNVIVSADEVVFDKSKLPAMELYLASKGETLWQLAKSLHMSTTDILQINPEITDPLDKDARIVVYNKI